MTILEDYILERYELQCIFKNDEDIDTFINQVVYISEGFISSHRLREWIKKFGIEYIYEKVILMISREIFNEAFLNAAIYRDYTVNYDVIPKRKYRERENDYLYNMPKPRIDYDY